MKSNIKHLFFTLMALVALGLSTSSFAADGDVVASGSFNGASGHITKGKISVVKSGDGYVVNLGDDFSLDGGPDPKLAFGVMGKQPVVFAVLKSLNGAQTYQVPASIKPEDFNEFFIWCEQYSVPLGQTALK